MIVHMQLESRQKRGVPMEQGRPVAIYGCIVKKTMEIGLKF